jgi:glucose/arabinose dehydrogenase
MAPEVATNLIFCDGEMFPQWKGSALVSGLASRALIRIVVTGATAKRAERWDVGHRIRDVEAGPDGALWSLEAAVPVGCFA